jgi:hypothetical protein
LVYLENDYYNLRWNQTNKQNYYCKQTGLLIRLNKQKALVLLLVLLNWNFQSPDKKLKLNLQSCNCGFWPFTKHLYIPEVALQKVFVKKTAKNSLLHQKTDMFLNGRAALDLR